MLITRKLIKINAHPKLIQHKIIKLIADDLKPIKNKFEIKQSVSNFAIRCVHCLQCQCQSAKTSVRVAIIKATPLIASSFSVINFVSIKLVITVWYMFGIRM